jgi:hypothetical protein
VSTFVDRGVSRGQHGGHGPTQQLKLCFLIIEYLDLKMRKEYNIIETIIIIIIIGSAVA